MKELNSLYKLRFELGNRLEEIRKRVVEAIHIDGFLVKKKK